MNDLSVATVEQLISAVHALPMRGSGWVYRGQPDTSYKLVPKAGRPPFAEMDDLRLFDEWRRKAVAYLPTIPQYEWEALAIAQHHGLATRLLDWTFKYAVAAYFAAQGNSDVDGAIYCYLPRSLRLVPRHSFRRIQKVCIYFPPMNIPRIVSQEAVFTCHPKPAEAMDQNDSEIKIVRIVIPAVAKRAFLSDLDALGVNEVSLFSDLDALSRHMNWKACLEQPADLSDPEFRKRLVRHFDVESAEKALTESDGDLRRWIASLRSMGGQ